MRCSRVQNCYSSLQLICATIDLECGYGDCPLITFCLVTTRRDIGYYGEPFKEGILTKAKSLSVVSAQSKHAFFKAEREHLFFNLLSVLKRIEENLATKWR